MERDLGATAVCKLFTNQCHAGTKAVYCDAGTRAMYVNKGNNPPSLVLLKILNRDLCLVLGIMLQDSC